MLKIINAIIMEKDGKTIKNVQFVTEAQRGYKNILAKQYGEQNVLRVTDITADVIGDYEQFANEVMQACADMDATKKEYLHAVLRSAN